MFFKNKQQNDDLKKEIEKLTLNYEDSKKEIEELKKNQKNMNEILESNWEFINILFLNYELKPTGILKNMQELSQELLDFAVNICDKYDLTYWISAGTLLGAYRHNGQYIPWDDDIDIGLIRKDYEKFCEVAPLEIKNNNAQDYITFKSHNIMRKNFASPYTKLHCLIENDNLIAACDILPYDYSKDNKFNLKEFRDYRDVIFKRLSAEENIKEIIKDFYEKFDLSYEKQPYIIKNPTYLRHALRYNKEVACWKTEEILPVSQIMFNGKYYNCPNRPTSMMKVDYGDYMKIPKVLKDIHNSADKLRNIENIDEIYDEYIYSIRQFNENFK